jgi:signal peptidase I
MTDDNEAPDEPVPTEGAARGGVYDDLGPAGPGSAARADEDSPSESPTEPPTALSSPPLAPARRATFDDGLVDLLRARPLTGHGLVSAVGETWPGFLDGREGYVYPVLMELRREGRVVSTWESLPQGRRLVHRAADGDGPALPAGTPWLPPVHVASSPDVPSGTTALLAGTAVAVTGAASDAALDPVGVGWAVLADVLAEAGGAGVDAGAARDVRGVLRRVTKRLAFAPRVDEECRAEVLHHLEDSGAARTAEGAAPSAAVSAAVRAFGDPWKVAVDLERAARGRRTVVFPRNRRESALQLVIYDAGILVMILAAIAFVRVEVVSAYHIPTKSMEPTFHGDPRHGDRILVFKLSGPPRRFQVHVFDGWGTDRKNFVKRAVGLPGDELALLEGDLYVHGRLVRKEGHDLDALLFPVFRLDKLEERLAHVEDPLERNTQVVAELQDLFAREGPGTWQRSVSQPVFVVEHPAGTPHTPSVLRWAGELDDTIMDLDKGEPASYGQWKVPDLRFTVRVRPVTPDADVALRLTRGHTTYDAVLRSAVPGVALLVDGEEVARAAGVALPDDRATLVRFSQVDHVLRLEVAGRLVLRHDLAQPTAPGRRAPRGGAMALVRAGTVRLGPVALERDVYWNADYDRGERVVLGPDEYYMLGDNSGNSHDSRWRGAVHRSRLVGSPVLIVWPLSRFGRVR